MKRSAEWWDRWFLNLASVVSTASKDPSTQVGAVIVGPDKTILSVGYNGFPRGIEDTEELLNDRAKKYPRMIHAEMNAILSYPGSVKGATLYTHPFQPCDRCAVHIMQAGITRVVYPEPTYADLERWGESFAITNELFADAGIERSCY